MPQSGSGKGVSVLEAFLYSVAAGVLGSIIAHFICRAVERYLGNEKR